MPTMTNPETGETQEISMEELVQMMRSGQGSLQQIVTNADGSTSSTTLYGNASDDGLDRSVDIFVDQDAFNAFLRKGINKLTGEIEDPDSEKDPDDLYEMTVDFTDNAVMGILKNTKEELSINLYTRDERKATFDYLKQRSRSWKCDPDNTIDIGDDLQGENQTVTLYMLAFLEMRQFLRTCGKLDELKKLGNRGTGVILKATGAAEDAKATIVRGKNRPDLPCHMRFLGEQMMRPYMDEMMSNMMMAGMSIEEKIKEAEGGDPDCMENLAQAYLNGDGVEQDFKKSAYWWEKLAETDNSVAQFNIGLYYAKGCGVQRDFAKAAEWMKKAADNGDEDAPAPYEMYSKAAENLKKAEAGDAAAQAEIAKLFTQLGGSLDQYGAGDDYKEAFAWAQKSADKGDLDGIYILALCYEFGRGTMMSSSKAAEMYEKAARKGHAPSQWNLAVCFLNGNGVQQDRTKGLYWAYQAAEQGNELAISSLEGQGKTIPQIIEHFADPETNVTLEGTQYEGRAERCERIRAGMELQYKITKDIHGDEVLECFHNGGSVGLISKWVASDVIALLKLERVSLKVIVKSCIPKSQRGARARNADVQLTLALKEKKPETPEERAARLIAEEEARLRAEEERRRKEEEARRLAEEKRLKEEQLSRDKAAYEQAMKLYHEQVNDINRKRAETVRSRIAEKQEEIIKEAGKVRDAKIQELNNSIEAINHKKQEAEAKLASLGVFKFAEKKEYKAIIDQYNKELADAENSIRKAEADLEDAVKKAASLAEKDRSGFETEAAEIHPLPAEPAKPESILQEEQKIREAEEARKRAEEEAQKEAIRKKERIKQSILRFMGDGELYTVQEIMKGVPELSDASNQTATSLVWQLCNEGLLTREEIARKGYFRLS